jgi:K+-H+ exchange-related protein
VNVYFIPLGPKRFEPYYEQEDAAESSEDVASRGFFARMGARFSQMVRDAEDERHARSHERPDTFLGRVQRKVMAFVAERVAEQRLLWRLRRQDEAVLHVPLELDSTEGLRLFRHGLQKDADSHLRRLAVHTLGLLVSVPLVFVPGPNVLGYLFTFTVVGHFLAYRGAKQGLNGVRWSVIPSETLSEIGRAVSCPPPERFRRIHEAAERLRLPRLARFVERMCAPPA